VRNTKIKSHLRLTYCESLWEDYIWSKWVITPLGMIYNYYYSLMGYNPRLTRCVKVNIMFDMCASNHRTVKQEHTSLLKCVDCKLGVVCLYFTPLGGLEVTCRNVVPDVSVLLHVPREILNTLQHMRAILRA